MHLLMHLFPGLLHPIVASGPAEPVAYYIILYQIVVCYNISYVILDVISYTIVYHIIIFT